MIALKAVTLELQDEHTLIERIVPTLEWLSIRLDSGTTVDDQLMAEVTGFLEGFVKDCHHRKEEVLIFPILRGHSGDEAELAERLTNDHRNIERLLNSVSAAWESGDLRATARGLADLASLLRAHINVENSVAFAYVEMALNDNDKETLLDQMQEFDSTTGTCSRDRAESILESIIRQISAYA